MLHFIHISPEDLKKHPWIGLLIGLIGIALFTFVGYNAAKDSILFSKQQGPEFLDIEKFEPSSPFTKKWVTVTNFTLECETVEQTQRTDQLEILIDGPVYDTYTIITNRSGRALIVAQFHGDVSCPDFQNKPLTGILTTTDDYSYGFGFSNTRLSQTTTADLLLRVNEGLGYSIGVLILGFVFDVIFLAFFLYSGRRWLEKWNWDNVQDM
jgi:hypothetical protein